MKTTDSKGLLGNRVYLQVFSAYSLLMLGVFIDMLAIMTIVGFEWEVDPTMIGLIPVAYALPGIILAHGQALLQIVLEKFQL